MSSAPRVGLVGARQRHQGTGPFVAGFLQQAGAQVPCILGTSEATLAQARGELAARWGLEPRGYTDVGEMLANEHLDALAVLSPPETHGRFLELALEAGLAAFCEKPLTWGGDDPLAETAGLLEAFEQRGQLLVENCQWPLTLPAYERLHPGARAVTPGRFEMLLQPASSGADRLRDSLSHPLSLLQELPPGEDGRVADVDLEHGADGHDELLRFSWRAGQARVAASLRLVPDLARPRRAGYALDGRWAWREVREEDYSLRFACGDRSVPVPDPLRLSVTSFVERLREPRRSAGAIEVLEMRRILQRAQAMQAIVRACAQEKG